MSEKEYDVTASGGARSSQGPAHPPVLSSQAPGGSSSSDGRGAASPAGAAPGNVTAEGLSGGEGSRPRGSFSSVEDAGPPRGDPEDQIYLGFLESSDDEEDVAPDVPLPDRSFHGLVRLVEDWMEQVGNKCDTLVSKGRYSKDHMRRLVAECDTAFDAVEEARLRYEAVKRAGAYCLAQCDLLRERAEAAEKLLLNANVGVSVLRGEVEVLREEVGRVSTASRPSAPPLPPPPRADGPGAADSLEERVVRLVDGRLASFRRELISSRGRGGLVGGGSAVGGAGPAAVVPPPAGGERKRRRKRRRRGGAVPPAAPVDSSARPGRATPSLGVDAPAGRGVGGAAGPSPFPPRSGSARRPRLPGSAAISLLIPAGCGLSYRDVLARAKGSIDLGSLGVPEVKTRSGMSGGLIIEVAGPDRVAKADGLAVRLKEVLGGDVRVTRPSLKRELMVRGLDIAATREEVVAAVSGAGGCLPGDVAVGAIRQSPPGGACAAWVRCPAAAAIKLERARKLRVGWALAGVVPLGARPFRCYRCLEFGHSGQRCDRAVARAGRCYRCGAPGHVSRVCGSAGLRCPLCADLGRPAEHALGGRGCLPPPPVAAAVRSAPPPAPSSMISATGAGRRGRKRRSSTLADEDRRSADPGGTGAPLRLASGGGGA